MSANLKLVINDEDEAELRQTLRDRLEARDAATVTRDKAKAIVESAAEHLATCAAELRRYDSLDADIATHRAGLITASLEAGDGLPSLAPSPELAKLSAQRSEAANRSQALSQATVQLRDNLAWAEQALTTAQANAATAAARLVAYEVDKMSVALRALETEAGCLRRKMLSATATRPGVAFPVSSDTIAMLRDVPINSLFKANSGADARVFDQYLAKLLMDSEARFDG